MRPNSLPAFLLPQPIPELDAIELYRLLDSFTVDEGHWLWDRLLTTGGYGRFRHYGKGSKFRYGHRLVFTILRGAIPELLEVNHKAECLVRNCVRPSHLEAITKSENCTDANVRRWAKVGGDRPMGMTAAAIRNLEEIPA